MEIALGHINVDNICVRISIECGNKICNEFSTLSVFKLLDVPFYDNKDLLFIFTKWSSIFGFLAA
jgi:hypothetical protein